MAWSQVWTMDITFYLLPFDITYNQYTDLLKKMYIEKGVIVLLIIIMDVEGHVNNSNNSISTDNDAFEIYYTLIDRCEKVINGENKKY